MAARRDFGHWGGGGQVPSKAPPQFAVHFRPRVLCVPLGQCGRRPGPGGATPGSGAVLRLWARYDAAARGRWMHQSGEVVEHSNPLVARKWRKGLKVCRGPAGAEEPERLLDFAQT